MGSNKLNDSDEWDGRLRNRNRGRKSNFHPRTSLRPREVSFEEEARRPITSCSVAEPRFAPSVSPWLWAAGRYFVRLLGARIGLSVLHYKCISIYHAVVKFTSLYLYTTLYFYASQETSIPCTSIGPPSETKKDKAQFRRRSESRRQWSEPVFTLAFDREPSKRLEFSRFYSVLADDSNRVFREEVLHTAPNGGCRDRPPITNVRRAEK